MVVIHDSANSLRFPPHPNSFSEFPPTVPTGNEPIPPPCVPRHIALCGMSSKYPTQFIKFQFSFPAWIGSLGIAMTYVGSPVAGCIVNRFGCRATILTGGFLCITGLALTSFAPNIYVMYLTLSCITGFGGCCIFMASFLIVPQYFHNRRSLATGIVASGTGLGVLVMAPVIQALLDSVGLSNTYRVLAAVFLTVIVLGCTFQPVSQDSHDNEENTSVVTAESSAPKERPAIKLLDLSVWKVPAFTVITVSVAVGFFGHSVPRIHLVSARKVSLLKFQYDLCQRQLYCLKNK